MYTNTTSLAAAWAFSATSSMGATGSSGTGEGDAFSKLFNSIKSGSQGGLDSVLSSLADRFPSLSFSAGKVGSKEDTSAAANESDEVKDTAKVDEDALVEMSASQSFASMIEKALSSFLDATQNMQAMNGAYNQRSVSISITTISFSVNQVDRGSGETLSSQELQSAIKEKLDELIKKVFGAGASGQTTEDTDNTKDTEETDATNSAAKTNSKGSDLSYGISGWSMSLYYSQSLIQGSQGGNNGSMSSWGASFSMQAFLGSSIPQELYSLTNGESTMDSLREMMTGVGMSVSSFSQTQDGISMRLAESRNLLGELLEMLNQRNQTRLPAAPPEEEEEDTAAEAAQEVEAAEVAEVAAE